MPDQRFVVLRAEHVTGSDGFSALEDAIGHAVEKVKGDKTPRYVVTLTAQLSPDPVPAVVINRYDGDPSDEREREAANR